MCEAIITAAGGKAPFGELLKLFDFESAPEQTDEQVSALFSAIAGQK